MKSVMDLKTALMILALAATTGAATACFGVFSRKPDSGPKLEESCEGLEGRAKSDCEKRTAPRSP